MDFVFQFQALRAMVQANPQILQVLLAFYLYFSYMWPFDKAEWKKWFM